jgi:hypothetical protein
MVLLAVLDVDEPILEAQRNRGALAALAGWDLYVATAVMDERDGADKVLQE